MARLWDTGPKRSDEEEGGVEVFLADLKRYMRVTAFFQDAICCIGDTRNNLCHFENCEEDVFQERQNRKLENTRVLVDVAKLLISQPPNFLCYASINTGDG